MLWACLCSGSSRAKAPLGMQCCTQLWYQRVGYNPDATSLTRAETRAGRGSLLLCSYPWGCRVGHQLCPLCRGVVEGDDDMASGMAVFVTSQSPHRFHFLTWHSVSFNFLQAVIYPLLSGASSLLQLHLGRAFSEGKFLEPPSLCHWRCFQHEISSLSLTLQTWAVQRTVLCRSSP